MTAAKNTTPKATTTPTRATKTTPGKPAAKQAPAKESRVFVTGGRFDASAADTHKCEGACGLRLPVKKFPTITGTQYRIGECRSCRDTRTKAAKKEAGK